MNNPLVSIIIPVYNVSNYIEECINSVIAQTYSHLEVILVDDCGTDDSMVQVKRIVEGYHGEISFTILHHEHNRGVSAARNTGIDNAKGTFVVHVDSDDYIEINAIESMMYEQMRTNADIVFSKAIIEYSDKSEIIEFDRLGEEKKDIIRETLRYAGYHNIWGKLIRLSLYRQYLIRSVEGVDIGDDWQVLPFLIYYAQKLSYVDKILYHYRFTRNDSYMHISFKDIEYKKRYLIQVVRTLQYLIDNFHGKGEENYLDILYKQQAIFSFDAMVCCCRCGDKESFENIRPILSSVPKNFLSTMGRHDRFSFFIKTHYYCLRFLLFFK